jgi:iron complex transport system substrate-binding protein
MKKTANSKKTFIERNGEATAYAAVACALAFLCACSTGERRPEHPDKCCSRIVSLAPSITETLFALSLGENVVGVTGFCSYPPQATSLPKLGGFFDPNFERILSLRPTLAVVMKEHQKTKHFLQSHSIPYLEIDNHNSAAICSSFARIGRTCGRRMKADSLIGLFARQLDTPAAGDRSVRVLVSVERIDPGSGNVSTVYAAGPNSFYHDMILAAGAQNCITDSTPDYPQIAPEGIVRLQPDIIIDILPSMSATPVETLKDDWLSLPVVAAVQTGCVFCITDPVVTIPGPRLPGVFERIREIIQQCRST